MSHSRTAAVVLVVALAAGAFGYFASRWLGPSAPTAPTAAAPPVQPEFRPVFTLNDVEGTPRTVTEWDGKALLINFWATWCPPCRREIPLLNDLQKTYGPRGLQVVGVALDTREAVRDYQETTPLSYPSLVGELDAIEVGKKFGLDLYGLPISILTDAHGRILAVHMGELQPEAAIKLVEQSLGPAPVGETPANP